MNQDLIFDVGMHNGDDTAYYLSRGFRVVAIEANPRLIAAAESRFADAISAGRLRLYHRAVCLQEGPVTLWVNTQQSEHSSINPEMASRFHKDLQAVEVQGVRLASILKNEGVPFYLKIDIEGADAVCLQDLERDDLPAYVSAEAHSLDPLFELHKLGYQRFKCINQLHHNNPEKGIRPAFGTGAAMREALGFVRGNVSRNLKNIPGLVRVWRLVKNRRHTVHPQSRALNLDRLSDASGGAGCDQPNSFPRGSSGPFAEETCGAWRTFEEIAYDWLHIRRGFPGRSRLTRPGWFDFHAKRDEREGLIPGPAQ